MVENENENDTLSGCPWKYNLLILGMLWNLWEISKLVFFGCCFFFFFRSIPTVTSIVQEDQRLLYAQR